jgi:PAS domain S-box-containing protein
LIWTDDQAREQLISRIRAEGRITGLEMQIRTKAGAMRDGLVSLELIELDREAHLLVDAKDVTEQKRVSAALRESEERFRRLVQDLGVGVVVLDPDFRILLCNPAATTMLGLPRHELLGRVIHELPFESLREDGTPFPTTEHPSSVARRTGRPVHHVVLGHRVRGRADWAWHLVAAEPQVEPDGAVRQIVVTFYDITERRLAEEHLVELQASLRRTETMSALGAVVAGVAHEVRNPLFAISATVDAFEARFGAEPKHARYIQALRREVERLSELMSALLDYGRPPSLELAEHALEDLITRAVGHCTALAQSTNVRIEVELPGTLPRLRLDASRMVQVYQNLIDNAVRHSPADGVVTVRAAVVREADVSWSEVTVADRGSGIPEDDLPHVFEPFFSRRHGGTGLGLSIVQRIVEQHGGEVRAANRPDGGAIMVVRLPS